MTSNRGSLANEKIADEDEFEDHSDICAVCCATETEFACGGCGILEYCSPECAKKHWDGYSFSDTTGTGQTGAQVTVPAHATYCGMLAKLDEEIDSEKSSSVASVLTDEERKLLQIDEKPEDKEGEKEEAQSATSLSKTIDHEDTAAKIQYWITDEWTGIEYWVPDGPRRYIYWPIWGWKTWWWRPWWWFNRQVLRRLPLTAGERDRYNRLRRPGWRGIRRGPPVVIRRQRPRRTGRSQIVRPRGPVRSNNPGPSGRDRQPARAQPPRSRRPVRAQGPVQRQEPIRTPGSGQRRGPVRSQSPGRGR